MMSVFSGVLGKIKEVGCSVVNLGRKRLRGK